MNDYFSQIGIVPEKSSLLRIYIFGFVLSLLATLAAFHLVMRDALPQPALIACIVALALFQAAVQARCFLHLNFERGSRKKLIIFGVAVCIVAILVGGSLWIMTHLNARMMSDPSLMEEYMQSQDGF